MTQMQRVIKYIAMAFAIILIVAIFSGIFTALAGLSYVFDKDSSKAIVTEDIKVFSVTQDISKMEIDVNAAELVINKGDSLTVRSNCENLTVDETNGRLKIKEKSKWFSVDDNIVIYVTIPDTCFKEVKMTAGAGKVAINSLCADKIDFEFGAGEVDIDYLTVNAEADIEGGAGALTINNGVVRDLDLDMGVGELIFASQVIDEGEFNLGVGNATITLFGDGDDYKVHVNKGVGEAIVNGEKVSDNSTIGKGDNRIEIDGGVGEINVSFN